jgi:hypothetical protein
MIKKIIMSKKSILYISVIIFLFFSCTNKEKNFKREAIVLNSEVFYGVDINKQAKDSNLISLMISDLNNAFKLSNINESSAEQEVRIYSIYPFGEAFFRQIFTNGITSLSLHICNTVRRKDSLFMNFSDVVKSEGRYNYDGFLNIDIPNDTLSIYYGDNETNTLDAVATFLVQVKTGAKSRFFLIEKPFSIEDKNSAAKYICNIIRTVNKNFSFKFNSPRKKIVDSAFINPYGLLK